VSVKDSLDQTYRHYRLAKFDSDLTTETAANNHFCRLGVLCTSDATKKIFGTIHVSRNSSVIV
jgi:hypothetical protein